MEADHNNIDTGNLATYKGDVTMMEELENPFKRTKRGKATGEME